MIVLLSEPVWIKRCKVFKEYYYSSVDIPLFISQVGFFKGTNQVYYIAYNQSIDNLQEWTIVDVSSTIKSCFLI